METEFKEFVLICSRLKELREKEVIVKTKLEKLKSESKDEIQKTQTTLTYIQQDLHNMSILFDEKQKQFGFTVNLMNL